MQALLYFPSIREGAKLTILQAIEADQERFWDLFKLTALSLETLVAMPDGFLMWFIDTL